MDKSDSSARDTARHREGLPTPPFADLHRARLPRAAARHPYSAR